MKSYFVQSFNRHPTQWTMILIETLYSIFNLISSSSTYCSQNLIPRYCLSLASTFFLLLIQHPTGAKNANKSIQYYVASFINILALFHEIKLALNLDDDSHEKFFLAQEEEFRCFFRIDLLLEILWRIVKFQPLSGGLINYIYISVCLYTFYIISVSPEYFACSLKFISQAIFLSIILLYSHKKHHKPPPDTTNQHKHTQMLLNIFDFINEGTVVLDLKGEIKLFNKSLTNFFVHNVNNKLTLEDLNNLFLDLKFVEKSAAFSNPISPHNQSQENPLRVSRRETSQIISQNLEDSYFDEQAQSISCIKDLIDFYIKLNQNVISTFRARIHHHHTQEWHNMEIKVYLLTNLEEKHLLLSIKDLTEFDRRSLSLEKEKLIYRDSLIASFSHELRTPLNSNLGFLEQSLDSALIPSEAKEKFLKPALTSGRLLYFIISDILDYSLILAHGLRLDITGQNLMENVKSCMKLIQPKLIEKGLTFKFTTEGNIPQIFYTDHKRLSQIVINLLNNAIQFTMKGELEVILTECWRNNVKISVKDTGIGMDENSQERLQNNLDQEELNQKVNDSSIGIGLGLFISNKLVKMLNQQRGGLKFRSGKDQGSIFSFEIWNQNPVGNDVENSPSNRLSRFEIEQTMNLNTKVRQYNTKEIKNIFKRRVSQGKIRVLVVDDEIFNIIVIENFCKALGIEVEKALNGKEAVDKLRACAKEKNKAAIKMVFMDINMPVMDGYQATREVHKMIEDGEIEDVTVIGVTAYISWEKIEKGYKSGMADILTKPISKEMIVEIFKKYRIL